jgi:dTDP-glucose 4,6-dehydratase
MLFQKIDAVLHFASPASPNPHSPFGYVNLPIQTMKAGALGTHNSLGVARSQSARFVGFHELIYGDREHHQKESW